MAMNSVNTNVGAMVALQSLETTQQQLGVTQKQISTGSRVADSTDDGAAYAIAQNIRSSVGGLTSANQQLGNVQGLLTTTQKGLNEVSNMMNSMRDVLVKLGDASLNTNDRKNYQTQYASMAVNVKTFISDATYNGKSLIGDITPTTSGFGSLNVARDGVGSSYTINALATSAVYTSLNSLSTATSTVAAAALTASGNFINQQTTMGTNLNKIGSNINYVSHQVSYNSDKIDALNSGLGSLVDADLAKESAMLTALQIRQQLGTQALSLANQAPQTLLSLFK